MWTRLASETMVEASAGRCWASSASSSCRRIKFKRRAPAADSPSCRRRCKRPTRRATLAREHEEERCASSHSVTEMLAQLLTETRAATLAAATLARANHTDATTLASTNHTGAMALASTNHAATQSAHARMMAGQQLLVQQVHAGQQVMVAGQQALAQQSSDIAQQMAALVDESSRSQRGAPAPAPGAPAPVSPRRAFGRSLHREHRYRLRQAPFGRLGPPSLDVSGRAPGNVLTPAPPPPPPPHRTRPGHWCGTLPSPPYAMSWRTVDRVRVETP